MVRHRGEAVLSWEPWGATRLRSQGEGEKGQLPARGSMKPHEMQVQPQCPPTGDHQRLVNIQM